MEGYKFGIETAFANIERVGYALGDLERFQYLSQELPVGPKRDRVLRTLGKMERALEVIPLANSDDDLDVRAREISTYQRALAAQLG